ncbi:MAG: hypothetical protein MSC31_14295 [Solirubrobacteraceae bacterium MAG38_C4-C5]|nr:hypothetical protein [Candidatus Siliceabacter maunaloa]
MKTVDDLKALPVAELQQLIGGLVGQPFAGARTSYGDELRVSFGSALERTSGWELGTRAARWVLLGNMGILCRETDGPRGLSGFQALGGASVAAVDATRSDRTLALAFDSGHHFVVMPNKPHRTKDDLDLWELFSPHGWWLAVRRDGSIELIPDEMPLVDRQRRHKAA